VARASPPSLQKADFGASEVPMTASEQAAATGGPSVQVPVALGAEVVVLQPCPARRATAAPDRPDDRSHRPRPDLPLDDPAIAALNLGIDIAAGPITIIYRSDSSATTYSL
jgi:ABC-type phosphate transport system substrate-binding protein